MTISVRRLITSLAIIVVGSVPATAQPSATLHPEAEVARWFAPILWPAVYETVTPTMPHAMAFDGIDNDNDTFVDLFDLDEVGFGAGKMKVLDLIRLYESKFTNKPPRRVLYAAPRPFDGLSTDVLEYWFYYFYDQGPGSHLHDPEHTFVFLDVADSTRPRGSLARYKYLADRTSNLSDAVRVVVAAAHEGSTANNILAATRELHRTKVVPRQLPAHMPLLAELGKHASAPDLQLNGRFDPGFDANMFHGSLWGLRDSLASGLNEVGFMTFEPWQSYPRDPAAISAERSFFDSTDAEFKRTYQPYASRLTGLERNAYTLFPMADMQRLYELLAGTGSDDDVERRVTAFLDEHRQCFWGTTSGWTGTIPREALPIMRQWARQPLKHAEIWKHDDHARPEYIFKLHLFPRFALGLGYTDDAGRYPFVSRIVFEVSDLPWFDFSGGGGILEFLFPGRLLTDSRLEISLRGTEGTEHDWAWQYDALTWKKGRGNRSGVYLGLQRRKAQILPGSELIEGNLREVEFETGVPLSDLRRRRGGKGWPLGLRAGVFFGHSWPRLWSIMPSGGRIETQAGLVIEPLEVNVSDVEQQLGARPNLRFQWGATFTWNTNIKRPEPWKY